MDLVATPTLGILAVCVEVAALLEPDPTMRDDAHARPSTYAPERLYVWPRRETFDAVDTGQSDQENVELRVAWLAASSEVQSGLREREVTDRIADRAEALAATVRDNRAGRTFEWIRVVAIDYEFATLTGRGFLMDLSGYQYRGAS